MTEVVVGSRDGVGHAICNELESRGEPVVRIGFREMGFPSENPTQVSLRNVSRTLENFVRELYLDDEFKIDTLTFAFAYRRDAGTTEVADTDVGMTIGVNGLSLFYLVQKIVAKQRKIDSLNVINALSQGDSSRKHSIYNYTKTGAVGLCRTFWEEGIARRVLVAEPVDSLDTRLSQAGLVAQKILEAREQDYSYWHVRILDKQPLGLQTLDKA